MPVVSMPRSIDVTPPREKATEAWIESPTPLSPSSSSGPKAKHAKVTVGADDDKKAAADGATKEVKISSKVYFFLRSFMKTHLQKGKTDGAQTGKVALKVHKVLDNNVLQVLMLVFTIVLLFAGDFVSAVMTVDTDSGYSVLLWILFATFAIEWVAQIVASSAMKPHYVGSMFFFLDFIACAGIMVDIVVLEANSLVTSGPIARAARAARIGTRAGRSIRLMRLMRFLRLVRVTRVVKMMLAHRMGKVLVVKDEEDILLENSADLIRSDTIGAQIGAATTKKVIIMTLILLTMISLLQRSTEHQMCGGEFAGALQVYFDSPMISSNCTKFQETAGEWLRQPGGIAAWTKHGDGLTQKGLLMAVVGRCPLYHDARLIPDVDEREMQHLATILRGSEIQVIPCDAVFSDIDDDAVDGRSPTYFLYDLSSEAREEAKYAMGFTCVIIVSLLGFSLIFANDAEGIANQLVVPVKQLMEDMSRTAKLQFDQVTPMHKIFRSEVFEVRSLQTAYHNLNAAVKSFSKFTPLEVVKHFLSLGAVAQLGVQERNVSLFFSDIAGWTTICEGTAPKEVLSLLSEYFESMVTIIIEEKGTMLEFIGDAILAIWNAPNDVPDHAVRAITSAARMKKALVELRSDWVSKGKPPISIRVGLHSSKVWVGNLGSTVRMKYGVLGDGVNLASRLEELNKDYKTETMISEDVFMEDDVAAKFVVRALDVVEVKGKATPTKVYEVLGLREDATEDMLEIASLSLEALRSYLGRDFGKAIEIWQSLLKLKDNYDPAGEVLIERCKNYLKNPPPSNWDGVER